MTVLPLPPLTDDLEVAQAHLEEYGLARLSHALDEDTLAMLRWRVDDQSSAEAQNSVTHALGFALNTVNHRLASTPDAHSLWMRDSRLSASPAS